MLYWSRKKVGVRIYAEASMTEKITYYVDESGDMTFFNKRGKPVSFDTPSVAKFFMIGVLKLKDDVAEVERKFSLLREELLSDPFIRGVPSLQKTAVMFHAKDDCALVKREVFRLLEQINVSVHVVLMRKEKRLKDAMILYQSTGRKTEFSEAKIYTDLTKRVFRNLLHKSDVDIVVAQRGKTFTTKTFSNALERAKVNFYNKYNIEVTSDIRPILSEPSKSIGLQIVDYYLWAVKKLYEDGDISFFDILRNSYKVIMDIDDTRNKGYGEYYDIRNRISLERIREAS